MNGRRYVFVDRDDTVAKNVPYCDSPEKFHLFPGIPSQIRRLNEAGFLVIMITNQSGINRGLFTEETLSKIHEKMTSELRSEGAYIDKIFHCPHRPDENCRCRKPNTLLGEWAIEEFGIDVSESYMIGDSDADMEFGKRLGCTPIRIDGDHSFKDAVDMIVSHSE